VIGFTKEIIENGGIYMVYENDFKYKIIALYCDGKTSIDLENEYDVSNSTIMKWFHTFVLKGAFNKNELNLEENERLENLRERAAIYHRDKIASKNIYDNEFKYKMITLLCDGKTPTDLYRKHGIARQTVTNWLRSFIAKDFFCEEELSQDDRIKLKKLRERAV
jgi:transposase-like protein